MRRRNLKIRRAGAESSLRLLSIGWVESRRYLREWPWPSIPVNLGSSWESDTLSLPIGEKRKNGEKRLVLKTKNIKEFSISIIENSKKENILGQWEIINNEWFISLDIYVVHILDIQQLFEIILWTLIQIWHFFKKWCQIMVPEIFDWQNHKYLRIVVIDTR